MRQIKEFFTNKSFIGVWSGQSFAVFGDILYIVALIPLIYNATGSIASTALVPFFSSLAQLTSGILAPAIIDRMRLRSIILVFQTLKATLLLVLYFLSRTTLDSSNIAIVFIFVILISFLNGWIGPARSAIIPLIVKRDDLVKGNGLMSTTNQIVYLSGYSLGGLLVAFLGSQNVLVITFFLYGTAFVCYRLVRPHEAIGHSAAGMPLNWAVRMKEGWLEIWRLPPLRRTLMMDIVETTANGVWTAAIMLVFVQEFLQKNETWWGMLNSGYYIGTILGGLIAIYISNWLRSNLGSGMVYGGSLMCILTFMFALIPIPAVAIVLCIAMGPAYQIRDIAQSTLFQTVAEERKLAKVNAARDTLVYALFGLAVLLMAQVTELVSVNAAYILSACLYGVSAFIGLGLKKITYISS